jgi:GDP-L-fucose synthase
LDIQKLLITGGTGLIGSTISTGTKLSSQDADLTIWEETYGILRQESPDSIIHCAARVGGVGSNINYKGKFFFENIMINTNVIEAARICGVKKLIAFLSTCVFPDDIEYPLTESKIHSGEPHSSNYPYAYAKRMVDIQIRAYREQYGLNYVSVIPTNVYGPNDNFNIDNGHVLPALIHKCYLAKNNNTDFSVWGSGKPLREFIYSEDVAKLTEWVLDEYDEDEPIIFTTSEEISIKDVVGLIIDAMGYEGKVDWQKDKPDGQYRKPSDNSKLKSYLPDFKFTPIDVGIKKSVEWFVENYEKARK